MQAWIQQAADNMKAVDPNHMVTVGEEGFYGFGSSPSDLATNPNSDNSGYATFLLPSGQSHATATHVVRLPDALLHTGCSTMQGPLLGITRYL